MIDFILKIGYFVFAANVALIGYTYIGYPVLVYLLGKWFPQPVERGSIEPTVSVIITAYNEEKDLRDKLENTLLLDYPKDKLEILVASDGSTDRTDAIVGEFAERGVKLFRQEGRVGKTYTQNQAVERVTGEIIVFSDATTVYQSNTIRSILPSFADASVGCVAGRLIYVSPGTTSIGEGAKGYWNYETFLKTNESLACSLIGVSGCLYAIRRSAYVPMYPEACSDFLIATKMYEQGLRTVYEPSAVCTEETNVRSDKEFPMRVRVIAQTFTDLWRNRKMMNPLRSGFYAMELISHKLFRYLMPVFLIFIFVSSVALTIRSKIFLVITVLQILFYILAFGGWLFEKRNISFRLFAFPWYFVLTNLASIVAFYKFLSGERFARWEPMRDSGGKAQLT